MNKKGFSYVELIIVIAIMGVMVGMGTLTLGVISRNNVSKDAAKLCSAVNQARSLTMAKGTKKGCLEISEDNGFIYYYIGDTSIPESKKTKVKFAQKPVYVQLVTEHGNATNLTDLGKYTFKFNRSTGGPKKTEYTTIRLTNDSTTCDVVISELTGKTSVELR